MPECRALPLGGLLLAAACGQSRPALARSATVSDTGWAQRGFPIARSSLHEFSPRVIADGADGFLMSWLSTSSPFPYADSIWVQGFDRNGTPRWPPQVFLGTSAAVPGAGMIADGRGGAFIAFGGFGLFVQHILADGRVAPGWPHDGVLVFEGIERGHQQCLCPDDSGGVIVAWRDRAAPRPAWNTFEHLFAQRVDAAGRTRWRKNGVLVCRLPSPQRNPRIAPDGAGGAFLTWSEHVSYPDLYGRLRAQRLDREGARPWGDSGVTVCVDLEGFRLPAGIVSDGAGGAILAWTDWRAGAATSSDVYVQRFDASGRALWAANGVSVCRAIQDQTATSIASDGEGGALIAWQDGRSRGMLDDPYQAFAQRITADGAAADGWPADGALAGVCGLGPLDPVVAPDGSGGAVMAWSDTRWQSYWFADGHRVFAQRLTPNGAIAPGWPRLGLALCTGDSAKLDPAVTVAHEGEIATCWTDLRRGRFNSDVYAALVSPDGRLPALVTARAPTAGYDRVRLEWRVAHGEGVPATLERRDAGGNWAAIASPVSDAAGDIEYEDGGLLPGTRYDYRLSIHSGGAASTYGEVSVETLSPPALALAPAGPQPSRGGLAVTVSLPSSAPAALEAFDVAGRRLWRRDVGALGVGDHLVEIGREFGLCPGIYLVRLAQGSATAKAKAVVLR